MPAAEVRKRASGAGGVLEREGRDRHRRGVRAKLSLVHGRGSIHASVAKSIEAGSSTGRHRSRSSRKSEQGPAPQLHEKNASELSSAR